MPRNRRSNGRGSFCGKTIRNCRRTGDVLRGTPALVDAASGSGSAGGGFVDSLGAEFGASALSVSVVLVFVACGELYD